MLWIVFEESSSSIMPLTAASTCSNRRADTAIAPSRGTSCLLIIEPYPDSVLPRIWRLPASQSSANFSKVTEDGRAYEGTQFRFFDDALG